MNDDSLARSEQARIDIISMMLEIGSMRAVDAYLARWEASLETSKSDERRSAFEDLRGRIIKAREIEEASGRGSLLDLDHPAVIGITKRYMRTGERPEFGKELAAALIYRRSV